MTSEADCKVTNDACFEQFGQIDILFNNVGLSRGDGPLGDIAREVFLGGTPSCAQQHGDGMGRGECRPIFGL